MNRTTKTTTLLLGLSLTGFSLACAPDGSGGFLPENDHYIPVDEKSTSGITEAQFNRAIDKVENVYAPIVTSMGATLTIARKWSDGTVNANASQSGKIWSVNMYGGLARHETITEDGMALVVCHEVGHHIGGAPKKGGGGWWNRIGSGSWASNEGQADYFATLKCLRKSFLNDDNVSIANGLNAPKPVIDACNKQTGNNAEDAAICIRTSMAGKSVADLFSVLGKLPVTKFDTPDGKFVTKTDDNHPKAQCRLDTYFQGSLCDVGMNDEVSQTDEVPGTCHATLSQSVGLRPACWFKTK